MDNLKPLYTSRRPAPIADRDDQPIISAQCPHLGTADDAATTFRYSSDDNCCWRTGSPAEISAGHQTTYCFTANYGKCPVYQSGQRSGPVYVRRERAPDGIFQSVGWRAAIVVAEVMLVLAVVGVLYYFPRAFLLATPIAGDNPRPTQTRQPTRPVAASLPTTRPTIFPTPRLAATAVIFASPSPTSAPTYTPAPGLDQPIGPFNLVAHRVETGESLISIAARFNTTRDVLIRVNGSAQRPIQSGQILVVPLGLVDSSQLPKMVAFQTVQDTPLDVIVNQLSGDMNTVRQLNALGDSNIVPAGRWLFIPQP